MLTREVEVDGRRDDVAVEEPLEIRLNGEALAVTMRTPGHDADLALGFLVGEGVLRPGDGATVAEVVPPPDLAGGIVDVLAPEATAPSARRFYATSSCGVCGRGALEEVAVLAAPLPAGVPPLDRALLASLPGRLRAAQPGFARTGGLHATGRFTPDGALLLAREDVGRHNAMDKVVGAAWPQRLDGDVLCVSGRASFELVQKAVVAGAAALVAVGAPSSLAVDLARERGLTLAAFARDGRVNVYADAGRMTA